MRSELALESPSGRLAWLRSQGLGFVCGQLTVALLAIGSVVITLTRDGPSQNVGMDDLRAFFEEPHLAHLWLYLLVPVLTLYALNTLLCTWDSVISRWRRGLRTASAYAPAIIHVSFLFALLAHGVGGLWSKEWGTVLVSSDWTQLSDGRQARLTRLDTEQLPNGRPKSVQAQLELKEPSGAVSAAVVGYNEPLSSGLGNELHLLAKSGELPGEIHLATGTARCTAEEGKSCMLGEKSVQVLQLHTEGHWGPAPVAVVRIRTPSGQSEQRFLPLGQAQELSDGSPLLFEQLESRPAVLLRSRTAPGNPWAFGSAALLGVGLVLMGRRWIGGWAARAPKV